MKLKEYLRIELTDISAIYLLMNSILSLRHYFTMMSNNSVNIDRKSRNLWNSHLL